MRYFRVVHITLWLGLISPLALPAAFSSAVAQEASPGDDALGTESASGPDALLAALKRERDPEAANKIAIEIISYWNASGSATVDLLMQWANSAINEKRNAAALDFLDQAIVLKPGYVAVWNQRATLHYTLGNYRKAMADINQVLAIEPRHFGALAGMAAILGEQGSDEMALKAWERYLEIYPADREAQDVVTKLSEKLAGSRI
ncbi:MAG: tetratricopeptide repeat protein [Allorhizobium sp.]